MRTVTYDQYDPADMVSAIEGILADLENRCDELTQEAKAAGERISELEDELTDSRG